MGRWYDYHWPVPAAAAAVALVHGAGEYCGRYQAWADVLNAAGFALVGSDLPGLGRSGGRRGDIADFAEYLDTVDHILRHARDLYPEQPLFLFGHSLGGLISVRYLQTRTPAVPLAGLVLSSPALRLKMPVPAWKSRLAALARAIWPTLAVPAGIDAKIVTQNPTVIKESENDPLQVNSVTARWYYAFVDAMAAALDASAPPCPIPALVWHAGADLLIDPAATAVLVSRWEPARTRFGLLDGFYHEIFWDPGGDAVMADTVRWMASRTAAGS
ncbi:MAG: alpha/beta fold hydrolase [Thermaerobacter sp.]|nr:alpha/beta fold hydrolase [Thermaerobacter sp.]